jgi:succinate dehydrogenase / fumarate reductase flavoprotein subunit
MADWGPKIIDLMDRLGVPFNRTSEGFRDQRRFGGTLYKRTAFAGATTGQQLLYALDEQVRRWEAEGKVKKWEFWDFLGPVLDESGRCRGAVCQDLVTMQFRAFPADAVVLATGGNGLLYGRSTMSMVCTGSAVSRAYQAGAWYGNGEFIQVHPTAIPGADKLRLMSESARGEGGRVWVPRKPQDTRDPRTIPESDRYYFLEERYPKYGNLVPRDIATREIFDICTTDGLSVEKDRLCVYLDLTHIPKETLDRKLGGILEIYEKFQGVDPRVTPMKIFPAVHYSMGGLWVDYEKSGSGGMVEGAVRNQQTNLPGLYAIGECDYQYHGANRLGANSLLSCIFSGLFVAPTLQNVCTSAAKSGRDDTRLFEAEIRRHEERHRELLARTAGDENPYALHQELGNLMTRVATVVRRNDQLEPAYDEVCRMAERWKRCAVSDTGNWTNQNVVFTKSLGDMFPIAKLILKGALLRDECRGAHFKPAFSMPGLKATDPEEKRREAEQWCDAFDANTKKWLKSTIAACGPNGDPEITYQDIDTSLIPPRPRMYGLVGADAIEEVWKDRASKEAAPTDSKGKAVGAGV